MAPDGTNTAVGYGRLVFTSATRGRREITTSTPAILERRTLAPSSSVNAQIATRKTPLASFGLI